jgi:hypothetical protein
MAQAETAHTTTAPASSRADRFLSRIDQHLPTLAHAAARRAFLKQQIEAWQGRYSRFLATEGRSEPINDPADPPAAADFLLTITCLVARRDAIAS